MQDHGDAEIRVDMPLSRLAGFEALPAHQRRAFLEEDLCARLYGTGAFDIVLCGGATERMSSS